jgi:Lrp/AsnC family transcriptional regulator, leucine-responsive regulatory protein
MEYIPQKMRHGAGNCVISTSIAGCTALPYAPLGERVRTGNSMSKEIDRTDLRILEVLQSDGRITNQQLAERVALSPSACLSRVRALEASGLIAGYHARIVLEQLRPSVVVYAQVSMKKHVLADFARFDAMLQEIPEIVEACRVSGAFDYLIKAVVTDMVEWKDLAIALLNEVNGVDKVVTQIVLVDVKPFTRVPVAPSASATRRLSMQLHPAPGNRHEIAGSVK